MVPNHMGIDSNWVIENPDWFLYRWESPFPVYSFEGPDLSTDSRVEIKIEDHYYDQSDAAVVFRLRHHRDGATRYMYHGNDGTTFAWNDTAQLDYSKAAVREHVIQVILHVARLFPIIRFDAAMVLAKRHVQRLWFPLPGTGGSIPSRAENAMPQEEFDALMPHEFWREVVDRVAAEVPGTLLLAEAFWLLEGYFVRTLGMHRVYNSAFMNMLRDEENAKYRSYLKKTIEFDPDILKRYVSFMSNPDERTAIDQFGTGDKYFGVCTLLATLPGLPMFGHGQIEGYTERYGMEFKQAKMEEWPNENLVARHQHEIAPLLKNRRLFAESTNFVLYDFWTDFGSVDENVFAYSNRAHGERAIILYNNSYGSTHGTIHFSAASIDKATGHLRQRSLAEGLDLPYNYFTFFAYRDTAHGLEYLCRSTDLHHTGLSIDLRGYQYAVLLNWRELRATVDQPWDQLFDALNGAGVYSVEEALSKLRLRPLHEAFRQALSENHIRAFTSVASELANKGAASTTTKVAASNSNDKPATTAPITKAPQPTAAGEATIAPSEQLPLHPRLQPFVKSSQRFFEKVLQNLPAEEDTTQSNTSIEPIRTPTYKDLCESMTKAALHLISMTQSLSITLPPAASRFLPGAKTAIPTEQIWAPVLAWITLHSLPRQDDQAALFDKLQLRSALSETFTAIGMEGENTWRAAARVRILLAHTNTSPTATRSEQFWSDPDVRWLAGVNESSGITYFNKEGFEELLGWLQLPALINLAQQSPVSPDSIKTLEAAVLESCKSAQTAGYNLDLYLQPEQLKVAATQVASDSKPAPTPASKAKPAAKKPKKPTPTTR
jgi:hypothetical protein